MAAVMFVAGLALAASAAGVGGSTAHAAFAQQGPKLTATGEIGNGDLGFGVALSADGNTALVAAPSDDSNKGAAFVFTRSGTTWTQQAKLANPTGMTGAANVGSTVALSADGNTALIGGPFDGFPDVKGAAWVYTRSGTTWTQQGGKLQPSDETGNGQFGLGVALSSDGNTAAIGGPQDNGNAGAGWIFTRSGSTWTQQGSKLTGAGRVGEAFLGRSPALSGDGNTVAFGGALDNSSVGAVWVFTRAGVTWTPQGGKLIPNDSVGAPEFGSGVSLSSDGTTMLAGGGADGNPRGLGAAWVFTRSGTTWTQQGSKLRPNDDVGNSFFGNGSLSSDGNIAVIAGLNDNAGVGAAWIFARSAGVWTQRGSKRTGSGATGAPELGDSTALSADGTTALIGGSRDHGRIGAAWVFFGTPEGAPGPTLTGVTPASPANNNQPRVLGTAPAGAVVHLYGSSNCAEPELATDTAAQFASPGIQVNVGENSTTTFYATATVNGETSACSSTGVTYAEDSTPPAAPSITGTSPPSPSTDQTPKVRGAADTGSTVRLYAGAGCTGAPVATGAAATFASSGLTVAASKGSNTYSATATDGAGNTSPCSASASYVAEEPLFQSLSPGQPAVTLPCGDGKDNDSDGAADGADPGCATGADNNEGDETLNDLVLCGRRQISLVRADAKGKRVVLSGLVGARFAGKAVTIHSNYSKKKLATVKANAAGQFTARVKRPRRRLVSKARFMATVDKFRSVALKLPQSLASSSIRQRGTTIELRGTVERSLLARKRAEVVVRRIVCGRYTTVGRAKPDRKGRYAVRFNAPGLSTTALYRAETRVRARPGARKLVKQFARALGITFTGQTG